MESRKLNNSSVQVAYPSGSNLSLKGKIGILSETSFFKIQCYFCGKNCKHEDYRNTKETEDSVIALHGLNSHWVTPDIIASQRLSSRIIKEFNIVNQFNILGITDVINLQEMGEHPSCGDGIHENGFSYYPEELMKYGISVYNLEWEDMSIPSNPKILSICQTMGQSISRGGKVLVHCHAGLGRTGLAIACYLLYSKQFPEASLAIHFVRKKRPGSIQTAVQARFIHSFCAYLKIERRIFATIHAKDVAMSELKETKKRYFTLAQAITRQKNYLSGLESRKLRNVPKIIYEICKTLCVIFYFRKDPSTVACELLHNNKVDLKTLSYIKKSVNNDNWECIWNEQSVDMLMRVLMDWIMHLKEPIIPLSFANTVVLLASKQTIGNEDDEEDTRSNQEGLEMMDKKEDQKLKPPHKQPISALPSLSYSETKIDLGIFKQELSAASYQTIVCLVKCFSRLTKEINNDLGIAICKHIMINLLQLRDTKHLTTQETVCIEACALLLSEAMYKGTSFGAKSKNERIIEQQIIDIHQSQLHFVNL